LAGFEAADTAGVGSLDAAQVLALGRELLPGCAEHRAALHCAHTAADIASDGRIERADFETLIAHVVFFNNLWHAFEATDTDGERQIDCAEFVLGCSMLSQPVAQAEAEAAYDQLQQEARKYHGDVTFDVFCVWCVGRSGHGVCTMLTARVCGCDAGAPETMRRCRRVLLKPRQRRASRPHSEDEQRATRRPSCQTTRSQRMSSHQSRSSRGKRRRRRRSTTRW